MPNVWAALGTTKQSGITGSEKSTSNFSWATKKHRNYVPYVLCSSDEKHTLSFYALKRSGDVHK